MYEISKFKPCKDAVEFRSKFNSFKEAWAACPRGDWMLWLAKKLKVDDRTLARAKAECANTVRHLIKDKHSIDAIDACFKYADGEISRNELDVYAAAAAYTATATDAAAAAYAAADAATDDAAAAYAASYAAAYAASYAAADADAYAASYADVDAYADADAYAAAQKQNRTQTADICRQILTNVVMEKI